MTHKSSECYDAVFDHIENHIFKMKAAEFMTDWESGLRKSLNEKFPLATLRGCWFHYKRAIKSKCAKLNLNRIIKMDNDAAKIVNKLTNLPLLPKVQIPKAYGHIKRQAKKFGLDQTFKELFVYFESFWQTKVCNQNLHKGNRVFTFLW